MSSSMTVNVPKTGVVTSFRLVKESNILECIFNPYITHI